MTQEDPSPEKPLSKKELKQAHKAQKAAEKKSRADAMANRRQFFGLLMGMGIDAVEKKNETAKNLIENFLEEPEKTTPAISQDIEFAGKADDDAWYNDMLALQRAREELWEEEAEHDDEEAYYNEESELHNDENSVEEDDEEITLAGPVGAIPRGSLEPGPKSDHDADQTVDYPDDLMNDYMPPEDEDAEESSPPSEDA